MNERGAAATEGRKSILPALRQQLKEKFPEAHEGKNQFLPAPAPSLAHLPSFPAGSLSELSPVHSASGLSLILAELLQEDNESFPFSDTGHHLPPGKKPLALIDGRDSFDPASYGADSCSRLLWVRCRDGNESLRCCDLLLHDGNLPLLILDLLLNPLEELRRIPRSSWYRLRNLARKSGSSLLVFTPGHVIPCATPQLIFDSIFTLADLERDRSELKPVPCREEIALRGS